MVWVRQATLFKKRGVLNRAAEAIYLGLAKWFLMSFRVTKNEMVGNKTMTWHRVEKERMAGKHIRLAYTACSCVWKKECQFSLREGDFSSEIKKLNFEKWTLNTLQCVLDWIETPKKQSFKSSEICIVSSAATMSQLLPHLPLPNLTLGEINWNEEVARLKNVSLVPSLVWSSQISDSDNGVFEFSVGSQLTISDVQFGSSDYEYSVLLLSFDSSAVGGF